MTDQLAPDALVDDVDADADAIADDVAATDEPAPSQRVRRWDRAPEPRDWRFWVGNLGRILIVTGLLMFGFVAYQLWGTGIETARAQASLENQFEELIAASGADPDNVAGRADGAAVPSATADDGRGGRGDGSDVDDGGALPASSDGGVLGNLRRSANTNGVPVAVDLSGEAVEQDLPPIVRGEVLARLEIPRIDQVEYIVPGVALDDLKRGSGHYPDTPLPGQLGNAAIAGHRTTYGAPFFDVDQLVSGDELIVTMANGDRFVYLVTGVEVVAASDYWVVSTTNPNIAELTLTSCHPKYTARDRIVVHSVLDPARSSNVGIPTFYELDPDDSEPIPGDDPVIEEPDPIDADAVERATNETEAIDGIEIIPAPDESRRVPVPGAVEADEQPGDRSDGAAPLTTAAPLLDADAAPSDAFSQGWFEDRGAFGQIAVWGIILGLIVVLAYRFARHFRRYWPGVVAGVIPFLVALYFFYQNVNRLLPPGI